MVLSFGEEEGARFWQEEARCPFDHYRDPERSFYNALGLKKSVKSVWSLNVIAYYGAQIVKKVALPKTTPHARLKEDPHQMGGDVTVDSSGRIVFVNRSTTPVDRPSLDAILAAIRALKPATS